MEVKVLTLEEWRSAQYHGYLREYEGGRYALLTLDPKTGATTLEWVRLETPEAEARRKAARDTIQQNAKGGQNMEPIYVINPWSKVQVAIDPAEVTQEKLDGMVLDREVCEEIHREGEADTPGEFFRRYVELVGPEKAGSVWFS